MWRDDLQMAVGNASHQNATRTEVEDAIDDLLIEYDWADEESPWVPDAEEDEVPDDEEDSGEEEGQTDALPPR